MKKWITAVVVVVIVIAAAVWYKAGSAPAVAETSETAATPAPTATPESTPAAPTATPEPTPTVTPANAEETEEVVDKNSPEYIKKEYHQEGKTLNDGLKAQGVYQDEDGIFRWPDGDPVTFYDDSMLPEGFTYEEGESQETIENSQKAQEGAEKFASGQDEELNAVIDQLYKEGYFN